MKQRSSKIVAFPGKIRRPPATLRGSLEGGAKFRAVFEQSEEVVSPGYS